MIQEFLIVVLVLTTLLGGGMLLSDMKGFNFKLPNLEMLKKLLPQRAGADDDDDYDDGPSHFVTYADIEERTPVHHDLLPSERAPAVFAADAPAVRTVRIESETDAELAPGTFDVHQPNLDRTDLEEPDPEIDAVVASLAEEGAAAPVAEELQPEPAPEGDLNDLMSFFEDVAEVSKIPTTLTESLPAVSASDLLADVKELRALLKGRRDAA